MALSVTDLARLKNALKEMSDSMSRADAEKDLQKEIKTTLCDELNLSKKVFAKMARVFHKQSFDDEVATHEEFEKLYESVVNKKP